MPCICPNMKTRVASRQLQPAFRRHMGSVVAAGARARASVAFRHRSCSLSARDHNTCSTMKWRGLFLILLLFGVWHAWQGRAVQQPPGVLIHAIPLQTELPVETPNIERAGYRVTPLQAFSLEAR